MAEPILRKITRLEPFEFADVPASEVADHYDPATFAGSGICWIDPKLLEIELPVNGNTQLERI